MKRIKVIPRKLLAAMEYHYFNSESPARYHAAISISERYKRGELTAKQIAYWRI